MDKNLTDITMVIDRSGSMQSRRADAEGGVNAFVVDQAKKPGRALVTIHQFDEHFETVQPPTLAGHSPHYTLIPRGWTALLDAVGKAIQMTGERLAKMSEKKRPGLVVFVIVTDGHENHSKEYTWPKVREMISHQRNTYNWQFVFLGEGMEAAAQAKEMEIPTANFAAFSGAKYGETYKVLSDKLGVARGQLQNSNAVSMDFDAEDRAKMS